MPWGANVTLLLLTGKLRLTQPREFKDGDSCLEGKCVDRLECAVMMVGDRVPTT